MSAALVVVTGHPKPASRTHTVAARGAVLLHRALASRGVTLGPRTMVDLALLAGQLLDRRGDGPTRSAVTAVGSAGLVVMASPTFRGTYTGLLKFFLDVLPRDGLAATVVLPVATAGLPAHRGAVDATLRPVLRELGAVLPVPGLGIMESELPGFDDVFHAWWRLHGGQLAQAVRERGLRHDPIDTVVGVDHSSDARWSGAVAG
jgi:FMN reductase